MIKNLNDVMLWNNSKKNEKQRILTDIIQVIQKSELTYIGEIYLK